MRKLYLLLAALAAAVGLAFGGFAFAGGSGPTNAGTGTPGSVPEPPPRPTNAVSNTG